MIDIIKKKSQNWIFLFDKIIVRVCVRVITFIKQLFQKCLIVVIKFKLSLKFIMIARMFKDIGVQKYIGAEMLVKNLCQ